MVGQARVVSIIDEDRHGKLHRAYTQTHLHIHIHLHIHRWARYYCLYFYLHISVSVDVSIWKYVSFYLSIYVSERIYLICIYMCIDLSGYLSSDVSGSYCDISRYLSSDISSYLSVWYLLCIYTIRHASYLCVSTYLIHLPFCISIDQSVYVSITFVSHVSPSVYIFSCYWDLSIWIDEIDSVEDKVLKWILIDRQIRLRIIRGGGCYCAMLVLIWICLYW